MTLLLKYGMLSGILGVLVLSSLISVAAAAAPVNISSSAGSSTDPDIWNVGSTVYVVWTEGNQGIFFRSSPNDGATWNLPLKLSTGFGLTQYPLVAAAGTYVYVVWSQVISTHLQVMFVSSSTSGASFTAPADIDFNSTQKEVTPTVATSASLPTTVIVGWTDNTTTSREVFVEGSANAGAAWGPTQGMGSHEEQVAAVGANGYAISDSGVFGYTTNSGTSWTLENLGSKSESWVWAVGNYVYVASESKGTKSQVLFQVSGNSGASFGPVYAFPSTDAWAPMIWALGSDVWIAYHTNPGGSGSKMYVSTSTNNGGSWSTPTQLANGQTSFPFTVWSSDGTHVFVGWSQLKSGTTWAFDVASSANGGSTWTVKQVSTATTGQSGNNKDVATGALSADGATFLATWEYIPTSGTDQIYFVASALVNRCNKAHARIFASSDFFACSIFLGDDRSWLPLIRSDMAPKTRRGLIVSVLLFFPLFLR